MLIRGIPAKFIATGGSCFLYKTQSGNKSALIHAVVDSLNKLPVEKRALFRIVNRAELDQLGADSTALLALSAVPGVIFANAPSTVIGAIFLPAGGGHHGYDPRDSLMYTGFIAEGAGILNRGHTHELCVTDIAPLIAKLLGVPFACPDGRLPKDVLSN